MPRMAVINVVGLAGRLIERMPHLSAFAAEHGVARVKPAFPAVTCTAQSTYLTGLDAAGHGIVGNGWYDRTLNEHHFWKQSDRLVQGEKIWETVRRRRPGFTCARLFWWFNMYTSANWTITPRPLYPADGRKIFDIYTQPMGMRDAITADLGQFPFPAFWGPGAGIASSLWIANAARWVEERHKPDLSLIYLPHLDYNLQRLGSEAPGVDGDLRMIDSAVNDLVVWFRNRGVRVVVLSEYGITPVKRVIHPNRMFREQGWLAIKREVGREMLDCGASRVFAISDHQVAHIYINDSTIEEAVRKVLWQTAGIAAVLDGEGKRSAGIDHARAGDLVVVAEEDAWFTYYYWENDAVAPDFARCVDIHRKYGYDPVELFLDPELKAAKLRIAWKLLLKKLGFRTLMDVIPIEAGLVRGSHGCIPRSDLDWPVMMGVPVEGGRIEARAVHNALLSQML